jgi:signal peptidase II
LTEETPDILQHDLPNRQASWRFYVPIVFIVLLLLLDQLLKLWVKEHMMLGDEIPLIGNWAKLHFIENNGIAFGMELPGIGGKVLLTSFRIIAAVLIFMYLWRLIKRGVSTGFILAGAMVFAGAVGNIIDSIFYGVWFRDMNYYTGGLFQGRVVDMFYFPIIHGHFPTWLPIWAGEDYEFFRPVFNLADSYITTGILLILLFFRRSLKEL